MQTKKLVKEIALDGLFIAILVIMTFVPYVGFIPFFFGISITIIHIPVIIGALFLGWKKGLLYGTAFGLASLIKAATAPVGVLDPYFVNPLISVLPRMLFGLLTGLMTMGVFKLNVKRTYKVILVTVVSGLVTLSHTFFVYFALGFIHTEFLTLEILALFLTNSLIEIIVAVLLTPTLFFALESSFVKYFDIKVIARENDEAPKLPKEHLDE